MFIEMKKRNGGKVMCNNRVDSSGLRLRKMYVRGECKRVVRVEDKMKYESVCKYLRLIEMRRVYEDGLRVGSVINEWWRYGDNKDKNDRVLVSLEGYIKYFLKQQPQYKHLTPLQFAKMREEELRDDYYDMKEEERKKSRGREGSEERVKNYMELVSKGYRKEIQIN